MNNNFLERLKVFLSDNSNIPNNIPVWAYYYIICNNPEQMKSITEDCSIYGFDIYFEENKDSDDHYTEGSLVINLHKLENNGLSDWENNLDYHYRISLDVNDRMTGYCTCSTNDEGFNYEHECCGAGCDWYEPCIRISKIEGLGYVEFDGYERDLWRLEKEWKGIKEETRDNKLLQTLRYYEEQIKVLEDVKSKFIKENKLTI